MHQVQLLHICNRPFQALGFRKCYLDLHLHNAGVVPSFVDHL